MLGRAVSANVSPPPRGRPHRGAALVLPAVVGLEGLARYGRLGSWDGLVHRRCRIETASAPRASTAVTVLGIRSGWEMVRVRQMVPAVLTGEAWPVGAVVTHDLARRVADARPPVGRGASAQAAGRRPIARPATSLRLPLRAADVTAWARANGDLNALHLVPGAAHDAGLAAGREDVVAHGLLLAALSLAAVPAAEGCAIRLTFVAPMAAPVHGVTQVEADLSTGELTGGGTTVLSRR